jgi:hypothetical protein
MLSITFLIPKTGTYRIVLYANKSGTAGNCPLRWYSTKTAVAWFETHTFTPSVATTGMPSYVDAGCDYSLTAGNIIALLLCKESNFNDGTLYVLGIGMLMV